MTRENIQWYNFNMPKEQWTAECPPDLQLASEKDKGIIGSSNDDHQPVSWDEVKHLVAIKRIDKFHRSPTELRRYLQYMYRLKQEYGSVMNFIINERLRWPDLTASGRPFSNANDYKVLYNDWPYNLDSRIVHLVVWVKFELLDDPETGMITDEAATQIQDYVDKTFCSQMPSENVIWFKNWKSLKSIHTVEHFHIMLYDPDMAFVHSITHGDVPQSAMARDSGNPPALPN